MPTTIDSAGITFNDATSLTSAVIPANAVGATQIANGSVIASKLGTTEQKQIAKAWVNFNGTTSPGTIRSSYNVSSVTKNSTGNYTVNFTTAMADANYSMLATSTFQTGTALNSVYGYDPVTPRTINSVSIICTCYTGTAPGQDPTVVNVAIFGN